jgi:hypothetical protein
MRTAHLQASNGETVCGEPWEAWQDVGPFTTQEIRELFPDDYHSQVEVRREQPKVPTDPARQCQACLKWAILHLDIP